MATLKLSDLKTDLAYPLKNNQASGKCLIHMKLTEMCSKSIDALVNSNRGAVFSLRFSETGGTMEIPMDYGMPRKFEFKTSSHQTRSDGQNILECVHQAVDGPHSHSLRCTGTIEHRVTVQGTDQIFKSTKERMKEEVLKRKEAMAQEIAVPTKGRAGKKSKSSSLKAPPTTERTTPSPTFRKPVKPVPPKSTTSASSKPTPNVAGGVRMNSHTKLAPPVRVSHSLKERVIHFLAIKPQRREDVLVRIRKETKKSENNIAAMVDAVLGEVSEVASGNHKLRSEFIGEIQIEEWPHYSDAERSVIRRRYGKPAPPSSAQATPMPSKRGLLEPDPEAASKRPKLEQLQSSTHKLHPLAISKEAPKPIDASQKSSHKTQEAPKKEPKHKKKRHKQKQKDKIISHSVPNSFAVNSDSSTATSEPSIVTSDPSSTTNDTPDFKIAFPSIATEQQRTLYKETFNADYAEYLQLKESIDAVTNKYQSEFSTLSEKLKKLPKHCDEAAGIRKLIRAKYSELQQNKQFTENKHRFQELHDKLDHIKRQVIEYDQTRQ